MTLNYAFFRKGVGIISLLIIIAGALGAVNVAGCCTLSLGFLRLVCPVGFLEICLADHRVNMLLLPGFLSVVLIIFMGGRFFCSWLCPASIMGRQFIRAAEKLCPGSLCIFFKKWTKKIQKYMPQPDYKDALALAFGSLSLIHI